MGWKYEYMLLFNPTIPSFSIFPLKSFKLVSSLLVHLTVSSPYQMQLKAKSKTENQMTLSTLLDALLVARSLKFIFHIPSGCRQCFLGCSVTTWLGCLITGLQLHLPNALPASTTKPPFSLFLSPTFFSARQLPLVT